MSKKTKILLLVVIAIVIGVGIYFAYGLFNKKEEKITISDNYLLEICYLDRSIPPTTTRYYWYADNHMEKYEYRSCSAVDCEGTSEYGRFNPSRNINVYNFIDLITDPAYDVYKYKNETDRWKGSYIYVKQTDSYYDTKILAYNKYLSETYDYMMSSYKKY